MEWTEVIYIKILPQGSVNSEILYHIVQRALDHLEILKNQTLVHNIYDTLLI